jgi:hypothetical protein
MIYSPDSPVGIDSKIYLLQYYIDGRLDTLWNCNKAVYGRCQDTERKGAKRLEANVGGKEYVEPFVNDNNSCVVGFRVNSRSVANHRLLADVDVIFTMNVFDILGTNVYDNERVLMQAYRLVKSSGMVNQLTGIKVGIDDVFSGIDTDNIKHRDMAPYMVFAFTCEIEYTDELC